MSYLTDPKELLPKLRTRKANGNNEFIITLRFGAANGYAMRDARKQLHATYGKPDSIELIESGDPDKLGDLMRAGEVAVRAIYQIDNVIAFVEAKLEESA